MYNSNTDSLGLILDVEVFFSLGHCSGALCPNHMHSWKKLSILLAQKIIGELAHAVTEHAKHFFLQYFSVFQLWLFGYLPFSLQLFRMTG